MSNIVAIIGRPNVDTETHNTTTDYYGQVIQKKHEWLTYWNKIIFINNSISIYVLWHVLEHLKNPRINIYKKSGTF